MNSFWRSCLDHFEKQLPPQQFKTWIKPLKFHAADHALTLTAPNRFVLQWIRDRFLGEIQRLAVDRIGSDVTVSLALVEKTASASAALPVAEETTGNKPSTREISRLNPEFTFKTFVTGKANELARAAAMQVAERLRREFGHEAHLAVTAAGGGLFVMAARAAAASRASTPRGIDGADDLGREALRSIGND